MWKTIFTSTPPDSSSEKEPQGQSQSDLGFGFAHGQPTNNSPSESNERWIRILPEVTRKEHTMYTVELIYLPAVDTSEKEALLAIASTLKHKVPLVPEPRQQVLAYTKKRYSDLYNFHSDIKTLLSQIEVKAPDQALSLSEFLLPSFPKKHLLDFVHNNEFIQRRRKELENYLNNLVTALLAEFNSLRLREGQKAEVAEVSKVWKRIETLFDLDKAGTISISSFLRESLLHSTLPNILLDHKHRIKVASNSRYLENFSRLKKVAEAEEKQKMESVKKPEPFYSEIVVKRGEDNRPTYIYKVASPAQYKEVTAVLPKALQSVLDGEDVSKPLKISTVVDDVSSVPADGGEETTAPTHRSRASTSKSVRFVDQPKIYEVPSDEANAIEMSKSLTGREQQFPGQQSDYFNDYFLPSSEPSTRFKNPKYPVYPLSELSSRKKREKDKEDEDTLR